MTRTRQPVSRVLIGQHYTTDTLNVKSFVIYIFIIYNYIYPRRSFWYGGENSGCCDDASF